MANYHKVLSLTDRIRLESVRNYISLNVATPLDAQTLADMFLFSESTLRRQFYLFYKRSIARFVLESRMAKAYVLLKEQDIPVSLVGGYVGYKDRSAFTHAFIKFYGFSPIHLFNYGDIIKAVISGDQNNHKNDRNNHENDQNNHCG